MFEQSIINDYRLGKNKGIVEAPNCFYLPVRITGSGVTTRVDENGELYEEERVKADYFTADVLKHCAALPILENHPQGGLLDDKTIKNSKIIGQTIDAWIQGDEIWGLARVYDKSLIEKFGKNINSTSPGILVSKYDIISGKQKEAPAEINHLAFVDKGHWDQIEGSKGFELDTEIRSDEMATEIPLQDVVTPLSADNEAHSNSLASDNVRNDNVRNDNAELKNDEELKADNFGPEHHTQPSADSEAEILDKEEEMPEIDNEDVEILDNEDVEILDNEDVEILDNEDVEILDDEDVEILDNEDEEIVESNDEEEEDRQREEVLDSMRETCDCAHPSLKVKMPHIAKRETKRSVVSKFMYRNPRFVDKKYNALRLDSMTNELADEVLASTIQNIKNASEKLGAKKVQGFVPTKYGFADPNF